MNYKLKGLACDCACASLGCGSCAAPRPLRLLTCMTTNPHLKLTKGDTHPASGVEGGLPARFGLTGSYGGTPGCCQ